MLQGLKVCVCVGVCACVGVYSVLMPLISLREFSLERKYSLLIPNPLNVHKNIVYSKYFYAHLRDFIPVADSF